jgi:hypothetical protein
MDILPTESRRPRDKAGKRGQPSQQEQVLDKFGVNQAEQERLFEVRRSFQTSLNKLSSNTTKEIVSGLS